MKYYIHETPGRVRVKTPSIKGKHDLGQEARELLESLAGVENVAINFLTGSITINYDQMKTTTKEILNVLSTAGFVNQEAAEKVKKEEETSVALAVETVGRALFGWAVGRVLEGTGLSFIAAFI